MTLTYQMRVCSKCRNDISAERIACLTCSKRFCAHSTGINDKAQCAGCEAAPKSITAA